MVERDHGIGGRDTAYSVGNGGEGPWMGVRDRRWCCGRRGRQTECGGSGRRDGPRMAEERDVGKRGRTGGWWASGRVTWEI